MPGILISEIRRIGAESIKKSDILQKENGNADLEECMRADDVLDKLTGRRRYQCSTGIVCDPAK